MTSDARLCCAAAPEPPVRAAKPELGPDVSEPLPQAVRRAQAMTSDARHTPTSRSARARSLNRHDLLQQQGHRGTTWAGRDPRLGSTRVAWQDPRGTTWLARAVGTTLAAAVSSSPPAAASGTTIAAARARARGRALGTGATGTTCSRGTTAQARPAQSKGPRPEPSAKPVRPPRCWLARTPCDDVSTFTTTSLLHWSWTNSSGHQAPDHHLGKHREALGAAPSEP